MKGFVSSFGLRDDGVVVGLDAGFSPMVFEREAGRAERREERIRDLIVVVERSLDARTRSRWRLIRGIRNSKNSCFLEVE